MANEKFLLIKSWGCGFWSDVDHVTGQLLAAELTGRIPVVWWGTNSLYAESFLTNAFELFFQPVSPYTLDSLASDELCFYPPVWNANNLETEDIDKIAWHFRNLGDMMASRADVVVSDVHYFIRPMIPYIPKSHWAYGMTAQEIYRGLFDKYLKLQPDIAREIRDFYDTYLRDEHPTLAVHIRGGDKVREVKDLARLNLRYHEQVARLVSEYGVRKILLLTDCDDIIRDFKARYDGMLVFTDCRRSELNDTKNAAHLQAYSDRRRKGIEVIKDTYLASMCDCFIGNGYSNVSFAVKRLRDWREENMVLFYNDLKREKKLAKGRTVRDARRRKAEKKKHRNEYPELYEEENEYVGQIPAY